MAKISKLKAVKPQAAKPSRPKILVFGKAGVGKTWTALDFPSVYYIDCEGGANLPHYTEKLTKAGGMYVGQDQGSSDFASVIDQIQGLATEEHEYKTVVIDSISHLYNLEISKEAERLGSKDAFGASKKPAINLTRRLISWIDRIDMNVVLIAHEKPLWGNGEQLGVTFDAFDKLDYILHLCLNIIKTGDSRKALVKKTRLLEFPDASSFEWSYAEFSKKYGKGVIEAKPTQITLASEEQIAEVKKLLSTIKLDDSTKDKWIAENIDSLGEIESEKVDGIIAHLKAKIAPVDDSGKPIAFLAKK